MNGTESCSSHPPAQHPAPGDQYWRPHHAGKVLVEGVPRDGQPVPVEDMASGVHSWIPRAAFDAAYELAVPRRTPWVIA